MTVRLVREQLGSNVVGQEVQLTADGTPRTAKTDDQGRATFEGVPGGVAGRARATVGGEELVSESFTVPTSGGLRVILVAGLEDARKQKAAEEAAAAAAPPVRGTVAFGPNSRVLMEFRDDTLQLFYVLEVVNNAASRVDLGGPLIIDLPEGAAGAALLEGSSPTASVSGDRVTVTGPFAPGTTSVQIGFRLLYDSAAITVEQRWPVALEQLTVAVEKVGAVSISSAQFSTVGEVNAESGTPFLLASGPPLPAGGTLSLQLTDLPVHSPTPRYVALGLAAAILALGAWFAVGGRQDDSGSRRRLEARRDKLLGELAALERRARKGAPLAEPEEERRQRLVAELEQIYGELDEAGTGPRGGGRDIAA
ncbi:MAG: hypothetical protein A3I61_15190 [Acidobacteria bacterium RIFCSPLOWO2_02_FULL_68_18]|nr:MAG: hypothetical protein A3I61_15190 [Acidobacteria bacterium RIFCSPLOWO2_02_FULL_68_18]OFW49903.1 MAG: hypothetical protein A3G77_10830 [Acidobacteria bacterium RIFCSPLOWO2_12_FULL_68_19]